MDLAIIGLSHPDQHEGILHRNPCFGKEYSASLAECRNCRCPLIVDGELLLSRQVCEARTLGAQAPVDVLNFSSQEVLQLFEEGLKLEEIFLRMTKGNLEVGAVEARQILSRRVRYLQSYKGVPLPDVPPTEELKQSAAPFQEN